LLCALGPRFATCFEVEAAICFEVEVATCFEVEIATCFEVEVAILRLKLKRAFV
jgi:hypothetical protein